MSVEAWVRAVIPRMVGAPVDFVRAEAARIIDDFCTRSTVWRQVTRGVDIVASQRDVTVPSDDVAAAHVGVLRVYLKGRRMSEFSHAPWEYSSDEPMGFTSQPGPPLVLTLMTIPNLSILGELDVLTYDKPANAALAVPSLLSGEFFDPIFHGVVAALYSADSRPYSNPALAKYHLQKFEAGISRAKSRAVSGFTSNAQGWMFPRFGV